MVITVFSPSGGSGKTTLALAISKALSEHGLTCLLEMDFTPGDVAVLTDIELKPLSNSINGNFLVSIQRPCKVGFDVLTGGYPDTGENMDFNAVTRLINDLKLHYQFLIIDTQSHLTANVVAVLLAADTIVIPVVDDIAAVAKLAGMIEYLECNKYADINKAVIVVNKAQGKDKFVTAAKLAIPTICRLPFMPNVDFADTRLNKALRPLLDKWIAKPLKRR